MEQIKIIRSNRKTLAIEITKDAKVLVRAPYHVPTIEIQRFLLQKQDWILKHVKKRMNEIREKENTPAITLTSADVQKLAKDALEYIPERVRHFAPVIGVTYGRITIRNQKTRWGSCSSKGNLNFNCLLMLTPPEVIDYVVVHELCHRLEMNHSPKFWAEVERILPNYKVQKEWLKDNGGKYIDAILLSRVEI